MLKQTMTDADADMGQNAKEMDGRGHRPLVRRHLTLENLVDMKLLNTPNLDYERDQLSQLPTNASPSAASGLWNFRASTTPLPL